MADAFQPRFVDLVRNYTTTNGTGNFVLGPAVNGFTGFGPALETGDSFYYSAIGVDKPAEREVGRGTLLANGNISRSPIGAPATNFTTGTKTVALIAAAEWFNSVQQAAGGSSQTAASRSALADLPASSGAWCRLNEAGREGLFAFDSSDLSAMVSADTAQGLFVAPAGQNGSAGAWVRKFDGPASAPWWGATPGGGECGGAIVAALATLKAMRLTGYGYGSGGSPALHFPASASGAYNFGSTTLSVSHAVRLRGDGSGQPGGCGSVLKWNDGATGLEFLAGSEGSLVEGLLLFGGFALAESESHAIAWDAPVTIRDVAIYNFGGDGLYQANDAGGGTGNSNGTLIDRAFVQNCRRAFYSTGGDVNAQEIRGIRAIANRQAGVWEQGFLGNGHYSHEVATNARLAWNSGAAGHPCSFVTHGGFQYAVAVGQEAWCSANAPTGAATNNQGWMYWKGGGAETGIPLWANGITVRAGGGYIHTGLSNKSGFYSCYSEDDQLNQFDQKAVLFNCSMSHRKLVVAGGMIRTWSPIVIEGSPDGYLSIPGRLSFGDSVAFNVAYATGSFEAWNGATMTVFAGFQSGDYVELSSNKNIAGGGAGPTITAYNNGTGPKNLSLNATDIRKYSSATGAQTATLNDGGWDLLAGAYKINGTTVIDGARNVSGVGGSFSGAVTSASPTAGNGYAAGAGGTVVQATSKSTGVTLNKVCGRITMSTAALAASTSVGFTLTNSAIAATDVVVVNVAAAATADSYQATVDAVSAGSCRISLRNISAASKSEAVQLNFAVCKAVSA